jgi:dethiobiotin synthetase
MEKQCERLIIEGSGGLLVPLGEDFTVADLIANLECDVVVVGKNKLGIINHTLLTVEALRARGVTQIMAVLMEQLSADSSVRDNAAIIGETPANIEVLSIPYLGAGAIGAKAVKRNVEKIKKTLARIADPDSFSPVLRQVCKTKQRNEGTEETKKIVDSQCSGKRN